MSIKIKKSYITEDQPPLLNVHLQPEQQEDECVSCCSTPAAEKLLVCSMH